MQKEVHVVGLDIAKSVFQVHGTDQNGKAVVRRRLRREEVESFFGDLAPCLIGMEACPSAHHWGRRLRDLGHEVRLIPAQYVRPFLKTNKNDAADAEAISEAVVRPSMRFVPIKEEMQQEILIFVHGCFWHRHAGCSNCTTPRTRPEFWNAKFEANVARDTRLIGELEAAGWRVAVIWECETEKPDTLTGRLDDILGRARGLPPAP
jgi:hypothetical protein